MADHGRHRILILGPHESLKPDRQKTKRPSGKAASGTIMLDIDINSTDEYRFRLKDIRFHDMSKGYDGKGQIRKRIRIK